MPELPEVETTLRGIAPHIEGKTFRDIIIRKSQLRWPIPKSKITNALTKTPINSIKRRGKYLIFETQLGCMLIHLGMSGSLRISKKTETPKSHDHVDFVINNKILRYNDPRRFGAILWTTQNPEQHKLLKNLGPEPLTDDFSAGYLYDQSKQRKVSIKNFIMDSHIVVGVGNIYANEALFQAGIHPNRKANTISLKRYAKLVICIRSVLTDAITQGGTTLRDFVNSNGKPGYFKQQLQVYGRGGLPCVQCQNPLKLNRLAQRATVYCAKCQR